MPDIQTVAPPPVELIETLVSFDEDQTETCPTLVIKREQEIPDELISELKRDKIDPDHDRIGEFLHFATIPTVVVEKMMREGVDFNRATVKDIVQWLQKNQLDAFITTSKRLY
jgi:hypothetical protein